MAENTKKKSKPIKPVHISQIDLIAAIGKHLEKRHKIGATLPRQFNAIIAAADLIVEAFCEGERLAGDGIGIQAWLMSDQTGISSKYMLRALQSGESFRALKHSGHDYGHPHDVWDFGRCLGLLKAAPDLVQHLPLMAECGPEWSAFVEHWSELEELHDTDPQKCSTRISQLMRALKSW